MKDLIVYFSRADENYVSGSLRELKVGNTQRVAEYIHSIDEGSDIFKLEMSSPYSKSYNECIYQAQADQKDNIRPSLKDFPSTIEGYDHIYLGYPNYWGTMPMAVFTFLDNFDFTNVKIKPFCTHEGSGLGNSVTDLKMMCPKAIILKGLPIHGSRIDSSLETIKAWVKGE